MQFFFSFVFLKKKMQIPLSYDIRLVYIDSYMWREREREKRNSSSSYDLSHTITIAGRQQHWMSIRHTSVTSLLCASLGLRMLCIQFVCKRLDNDGLSRLSNVLTNLRARMKGTNVKAAVEAVHYTRPQNGRASRAAAHGTNLYQITRLNM